MTITGSTNVFDLTYISVNGVRQYNPQTAILHYNTVFLPYWWFLYTLNVGAYIRRPNDVGYGTGGNHSPTPAPSTQPVETRTIFGDFVRFAKQNSCSMPSNQFVQTNSFSLQLTPRYSRVSRSEHSRFQTSRPTHVRVTCEASINGDMDYGSLLILFSSVLCKPTVGNIAGLVRDFTFTPNSFKKNPFSTYTIENGCGETSKATSGSCCVVKTLNLDLSTDGCKVTGDVIGGYFENKETGGITVTQITNSSVHPSDISIYIGTQPTSLTLIQTIKSVSLNLSERFVQQMGLNPAYNSIYGNIQNSGEINGTFTMPHTSTSYGFVNSMTNETLLYMNIKSVGREIMTGVFETLDILFPFYFNDSKLDDDGSEKYNTFNFAVVHSDEISTFMRVLIRTEADNNVIGVLS